MQETRRVGVPPRYARRRRVCDNVSCGARCTTIEMVLEASERQSIDVVLVRKRDLEALMNIAVKLSPSVTAKMMTVVLDEGSEPAQGPDPKGP